MQIGAGHGKSPLQHEIRPLVLRPISHICAVSLFESVRFGVLEKIKNLLGFPVLVPIREAPGGRHDYCCPRNVMHLTMEKEFDLRTCPSGL